jgi:hypothetical protein
MRLFWRGSPDSLEWVIQSPNASSMILLANAKKKGLDIVKTKKGKGTKIMAIFFRFGQ